MASFQEIFKERDGTAMTGEQAQDLVDRILTTANQPPLNDLQAAIFQQVWQGKTSQAIADQLGYKIDYINQVAARLWKTLSTGLEQHVSKKNIKTVLRHYSSTHAPPQLVANNTTVDWGESIDISQFYGRETELDLLSQWAVGDRCRTIGIFGLGGIGKTAFSIKLAQTIQTNFEVVLWRSLRQAPTLQSLLQSILPILNGGEIAEIADISVDNLIQQLRLRRCLIVFDNIESLLQSGEHSGTFLPGYENYGYALERICDGSHQSCFLIDGREKPTLFSPREGEKLPVRSLRLQGLAVTAAQQILGDKGSDATSNQAEVLIDRLGGNPLALKIVASNIYNLFNNDITAFLAQDYTVFGSLWQLLDQQFQRLSPLQQHIMYWLAIAREGISPQELQPKLFPPVAIPQVLEALTVLRDRSAIETTEAGLTQQPVVMEYIVDRLIATIAQELISTQLDLLTTHALIEAKAPDYVRQTQTQIILYPLGLKLLEHFGSTAKLVAHLQTLVETLRHSTTHTTDTHPKEGFNTPLNYAAGNLLNLLCHLQIDLQGWDFSSLSVRQAYLAETLLRHTNFNHTHFVETVFAETFGAVMGIAYSPNGKRLVTGSSSGEVKIWDAETYQELRCCLGHKHWIMYVCFSPDSNYVATASDDYMVKLWDANTGQCLRTYLGHEDSVNTVGFSPSGDTIASGAQDSTVRLWSTTGETQVRILRGHQGRRVWSVAFSPDGKILASSGEDCTIRLWDVESGDCLTVWQAHNQWARFVTFSPDGHILASCSFDSTIKLWDVRDIYTHACLKTWTAHPYAGVVGVAFSPDGLMLASVGNDRTVKLWDIATRKCLKTFFGHTGGLWGISFHPQKPLIASCAQDHTAKIWNLKTGTCVKTLTGHANAVFSVAVSPTSSTTTTPDPDRYLASGHQDRAVRIWHLPSGKIIHTLQEHADIVWSIAFSPNGEFLISGSADETVKLWQWRTGKLLQTFRGHQSWIWIVAFCPDNLHFASGSYDQTIKIWSVTTGECRQTLVGHTSSIASMDFSPNGQFLASGSYDNTIRLWDVETGKCVLILTDHENSVWSVKFSPDGQYFASCSFDCTIKLWSVETGTCIRTYKGHTSFVKTLQFTPDGQNLVSGGFDGELKVWNVEHGTCVATLEGHSTLVYILDVAKIQLTDGKAPKLLLFTGNYDETIKIWDLESYEYRENWKPPRLYEGMSIENVMGINEFQVATLIALGAGQFSLQG